jgi:pimeloyl-ACP methyl ester carboxylesterase
MKFTITILLALEVAYYFTNKKSYHNIYNKILQSYQKDVEKYVNNPQIQNQSIITNLEKNNLAFGFQEVETLCKSDYKSLVIDRFMLNRNYSLEDFKNNLRKLITLNGKSSKHLEEYLNRIMKYLSEKDICKNSNKFRPFLDELHYVLPVHTPLFIVILGKFYSYCMEFYLKLNGTKFETVIHFNGQTSYFCVKYCHSDKVPILMFPGIMSSTSSMKLFCDVFSNRTIIMPLIPITSGYGTSHMNIITFMDNIKSFLDSKKIKTIDMFGWSYGGAIATRFMATFTQYICKKVLLVEPVLSMISGITGTSLMRQNYFESLKLLCKDMRGLDIIKMIGFNHILHMNTLPSIFLPMGNGTIDAFHWDQSNFTFMLSDQDPITKDEYTHIYSKFKNAKILTKFPGTHGDSIKQLNDFSKYLS